jgi:hypothetical protein
MKQHRIWTLVCLAILLGSLPCQGQFSPRDQALQSKALELKQAQVELVQLNEERKIQDQRVKAGLTSPTDVQKLDIRILEAQTVVQQKETAYAQLQRIVNLNRKIDINLENATLRQAAQALASAAGVEVKVDQAIPADMRLTLQAHEVPLADVLETVARSKTLLIAPTANGVQLRPWPTVTVNGATIYTKITDGPWSADWGQPPNAPAALPGSAGVIGGLIPMPATNQPQMPSVLPQTALPPSAGGSASLTIVPLGNNRILIAEPGVNAQGSPGTWLTIYEMTGNSLKRISSGFHRSPGPSPKGRG